MFCPKCGQLLADGVKVCINCGNVFPYDDEEKTVHIEKDSRPVVIDDDERTMRLSDVYGVDSTASSDVVDAEVDKQEVIESGVEDEEGTALLEDSSRDGDSVLSDSVVTKTESSKSDIEEGTALLSEVQLDSSEGDKADTHDATSFVGYQVNHDQRYDQHGQYQANPGYSQNGFQAQHQNYGYSNFSANSNGNRSSSSRSVSFGEAIKLFFVNYVNFSGRASKSEYWWAFLFNVIVSTVLALIPYVGEVLILGLFIPGISVGVRRLHDVGRSGTYLFMGLIPIAGAIILILEFCKDSVGDNQWGSVEKTS